MPTSLTALHRRNTPGEWLAAMARGSVNAFDLKRLRADIRPFALHWSARVRSTNDRAARLRREGRLFAPAVVLCGRQTAGRGRGSNSWWSSAGSLTVTFVLPVDERLRAEQIPLIAGLAVREALVEISGSSQVRLKWPNDIVYRGRKLAGLLCERTHRVDLIGVGINVNMTPHAVPVALRKRLVSLRDVTGNQTDLNDVLLAVFRQIRGRLSRRLPHPFASVLAEYDRCHVLRGRRVRVAPGGNDAVVCGKCAGLDRVGRLLVSSRGVTHRVVSGHVLA